MHDAWLPQLLDIYVALLSADQLDEDLNTHSTAAAAQAKCAQPDMGFSSSDTGEDARANDRMSFLHLVSMSIACLLLCNT